ncbi:MAG: [FeFe] hydrogenase H-cluster radical SAM maturase HydG, partial [Burkholderiales bacterium]|nr:[FeFe] hydrogenase H-cluster radical SAM maturase HydG [Burkholderiales bacterium]
MNVKTPLQTGSFIDEAAIQQILDSVRPDHVAIREVLAKARQAQGLDAREMALLMTISEPEDLEELFASARRVKEEIYGRRLVLFAPLYVSNLCSNECTYCAFRAANKSLQRKALSQEEVRAEVQALVDQGHKRLLIVAGEASGQKHGLQYIMDCIATAYSVKTDRGEIRRINANLAPLELEEFRLLKTSGIGTFQLFQETYHRSTYRRVHLAGPKSDYDWRVTAMHRAMAGGIDDVGIGVLFGLYDWRFELLAMLAHIRSLEEHYGVGPHTISVPRMEPAHGSDLSKGPPAPVSDLDFKKIVAILRLTVPYTGMIMSTRESPEMRNQTLALGISQISAGSRTNPGAYKSGGGGESFEAAQFQLG